VVFVFRIFGIVLSLVILGFLVGCSGGADIEVVQADEIVRGNEIAQSERIGIGWQPLENGRFTTEYDAAQKNRTLNLQIATDTINGIILAPGEVFSFNEIIGKTTRDKGYKPAKIFVKGKEKQGLGGGICQLSSTLYNAAEYAGLEIIERHAHSKPVHYVEKGRDAATAYGSVDLKFKNTLHRNLLITAQMKDGELIVELAVK
jgi:vancomycin resistance protein YoaR